MDLYLKSTVSLRSSLVANSTGKHFRSMRSAIWLYLFLLSAVGKESGERLLDPAQVGEAMGISEATVRSWLGHLRKAGYVALQREGRFVWVRVLKWRQRSSDSETDSPKSHQSHPDASIPTAVSELAKALGEPPESPSVREILDTYDPEAIQAALAKVRAVPEDRIRTSRLALLRYLLKNN